MAEGGIIMIHNPDVGETLNHYLGRYTYEDLQKIFEIPELLSKFCSALVTLQLEECEDRSFQEVWKIMHHKKGFNHMRKYFITWTPVKAELWGLLSASVNKLSEISKWCSCGRLIGCVIECGSLIGGLLSKDTGYARYSNFMLHTATVFGVLGLASSFIEFKMSSVISKKITKSIKRDMEEYVKIRKWFQPSDVIELAISNCFPFNLTKFFVEASTSTKTKTSNISIIVKSDNDTDSAEILKFLFSRSMALNQQPENIKEEIEILTKFVRCPDFNELLQRIFIEETLMLNPFIYDLSAIPLQMHPLKYLMYNGAKALLPSGQHLKSVPVWTRIVLNGLTILGTVSSFWNDERIQEMNLLKRHLEKQLCSLATMIESVGSGDQDEED